MRTFAKILTTVAIASVALFGCGSGAGTETHTPMHDHASHDHGDGHGDHGHDPLVHRFQNAADWAKDFDSPERAAWQKPDEVVKLLQITPGMKVADIGAGTGYFEGPLSAAVGPSGQVLALDIEQSMVDYITARMEKEKIANVKAMLIPGDDPKLASSSVDRVVIVDTWHHIPGREAYAKKIAEGLVPGGFLMIVDFTMEAEHGPPKMHRILPEDAKKELETAGLKGEIAQETLPEQYVVIGRKPSK
ncbi:MAG: methyltransferase domain-containing protein [Polyangiaceae bacterium]